ncbi:unnamed protein product [Arctogadus glacialis]
MESVVESLCCREVSAFWSLVEELSPRPADVTCLTQHPGFEACCLNLFVLKIAYTHFKQDHGPLQASTHEQYRCPLPRCLFLRCLFLRGLFLAIC